MVKLILYSYYRSSASMRVRIALNLKDLDYEYRTVDLITDGGAQFSDEYRKLNPSCEVPTLVHDGFVIGQSTAILDYLDNISPEIPLFPSMSKARAEVWQACEIINSGSQAIYNHRVDHKLETSFGATKNDLYEWTSYWIQYGLKTLEDFLLGRAGRFSIGDELSAADCFLIPQLVNARRFKIDIDQYPTLARIDARCTTLSAFRRAAMDAQPDSPPKFTAGI